jgi:hypothetical protein
MAPDSASTVSSILQYENAVNSSRELQMDIDVDAVSGDALEEQLDKTLHDLQDRVNQQRAELSKVCIPI